jgi:hypothetical protein
VYSYFEEWQKGRRNLYRCGINEETNRYLYEASEFRNIPVEIIIPAKNGYPEEIVKRKITASKEDGYIIFELVSGKFVCLINESYDWPSIITRQRRI